MCTGLEPMMLASMAASAGGAAINARMQNQAIEAQNAQNQRAMQIEREARESESVRQKAYEASQADQVTKALFEAAPENIEEQGEAVAADETNAINQAADQYNTPSLTGQVENNDVNESIGATVSKAVARTREMLRNAATLSGQQSGLEDAFTSLGRMGSNIQTIGSNRQGSSNVSRMETRVPAATVTKSTSPVGDLLMLGGQLAGGMSGNAAGAAGGSRPFDIGSIFTRNRPLNAIPALGRVNV